MDTSGTTRGKGMGYAPKAILMGVLAWPFAGLAAGPNEAITGGQCPSNEGLASLCTAVSLLQEDRDPDSPYVYAYQRIVDKAACADYEHDEADRYSQKVRDLWVAHPSAFICKNIPGFDVNPGSILKLAARYQFKDFLVMSAQVWKVDLNQVDDADGRTLLDYVDKELELKRGTVNEPSLRQYHDMLRKAGAKRASEL
ncbi:hypothetical protein [Pseudoxanthomonas sp. PXM02]|uniref:hypothetical protein n=1 Tax=Pseudoxanthomonas sp. PXM02 TaxID=2769294 RepID=UPI0017848EA4|nr:hypothetical protein [Pseudoxanthomonas sp. PXM02]MBD9479869.1 hypothetical protein [Pseudoxanthomonas sp. PXM02]